MGGGDDQKKLIRGAGLFSAAALIVANMIGTGVFTTSGYIIADLGDPWLLMLAWAVGGVLALTGALCYGELGALMPAAGGEYVFLRQSFGPLWGFLSGWISLIVGFSAPIAASAMACAAYMTRLAPEPLFAGASLKLGGVAVLNLTPGTLLAVCIIVGLTALHGRTMKGGLWFQNWITVFKVLLLLAFVCAGLWASAGSPAAGEPIAGKGGLFSPVFAVSLVFVSFAYSGWNAASYIGGEIKNPKRNLPLSLVGGTLAVMVLYLLMNLVYILALGPSGMAGVEEVGAEAAIALLGNRAGSIFAAGMAFCLLSNAGAMILAGPRVYYAMSSDGMFFKAFGRVHPERGAPTAAVMLQGALAVILVLTSSFMWLLLYIGLTLSLVATGAVAGLFVLRRRGLVSAYRTPGYPWTPLVFMAGNLWVAVYSLAERPWAGVAALATVLAGCLAYLAFKHKGSQ